MTEETTKYCWSFDEEIFHGHFETEDEAVSEAAGCAGGRPIYIGEVREPREFFEGGLLGKLIEELISEQLGEEVGEVAENFALKPEQREELGKLILDWIERGPGFNCYGVKNVRKIELDGVNDGR